MVQGVRFCGAVNYDVPTEKISVCKWKGAARYFHVMAGDFTAENAAWAYPQPTKEFDRSTTMWLSMRI
jgi:uncharacterized protein (DUF427 family)